jgi:hypothetical protein
MESWRGRKAVLASRGETTGPRVDECTAALAWHKNRATLVKVGLSETAAEDLADQLDQHADTETEAGAAVAQ